MEREVERENMRRRHEWELVIFLANFWSKKRITYDDLFGAGTGEKKKEEQMTERDYFGIQERIRQNKEKWDKVKK